MATQTSAPAAGLREAKKQETRQLISDHATRLFIAQGFEQTTIAEIAAAARVAKKTVTNYFARKEDLALDHQEEFAVSLSDAVAARRPGESALGALRRAFADAVDAQDPVAGFSGQEFARMIADSSTLTTCLQGLHERREHHLAQALAEATDAEPDDITVQIAAGLLSTVHRVLFHRIQTLTLAGHPKDEIARLIAAEADEAFGLLEPALSDYATA
ncbi:TetR/AcrR family transcriptional regulator [Streptomyces noursei]|uniref:TetR/AcrR family transcriptional regulator n=1 Tax=Streptomyces noursei TaxID=1971 RepID=UPI0016739E62|nr:TetR/AcrR family transcriptional regulator [Streptomyces noursei]MCZ1020839.1 TetR/AcrR family transcriptional regulator [Streptomyces noursei]GGX29304.1 TetR family transcriptional regulator [Streptomyces noursei]